MRTFFAIAALAVLGFAPAATAALIGFGPRAGFTHDEAFDQFHIGGQAWIADLLANNLVILPSLEVGFGDDATILAINGDLVYEFTEFAQDPWGFYAGAGLALNRFDAGDSDDTEFGLNLVGGATRDISPGRVLFGELRIGVEDSPDLKLTFGVNFF